MSIVIVMLVGITIIDKLKRAKISRCLMDMSKMSDTKQEQTPPSTEAAKRIEKLKLNTNKTLRYLVIFSHFLLTSHRIRIWIRFRIDADADP